MIWPYAVGLLVGLPLLAVVIFGAPFSFEIPQLRGFNFAGGSRIFPEFVALTLALSLLRKLRDDQPTTKI